MSVTSTAAVVLHTFRYGETSKIVRLATRTHGVVSAIAKGAERPKSRFGARLQSLSDGVAHVYFKPNRDLQTLAGFDVENQRTELARNVSRYASGLAVAELMLRFSPHEPVEDLFLLLVNGLDAISNAEEIVLPEVALTAVWSMVAALGYLPQLSHCAVDGQEIGPGPAAFSISDGGFVCPSCARGKETSSIGEGDRRALEAFVEGRLPETGILPGNHRAAHRRLAARFVRYHVAHGRELKAL
ncbi:MAG: DNA repair protein RecO, partial [Gemmatimonadota bacterium]|nr:DNA repair protein RecO [Gemmatimonadota bacterium]